MVVKRVQRPCGKDGRNRGGTRRPERQEEVVPLRTLERNRCAPPSCSLRTVPTTSHLAGGGHLSTQLPVCLPSAVFSSGTPCQSVPRRCTHSFCSSRGASWSPWGNRRKSGNSRPWRKCLNMDYLGTAFYFQFEICPPSSIVKNQEPEAHQSLSPGKETLRSQLDRV